MNTEVRTLLKNYNILITRATSVYVSVLNKFYYLCKSINSNVFVRKFIYIDLLEVWFVTECGELIILSNLF